MNLSERFHQNLEVAQEENPTLSLQEQLNLAEEWTNHEAAGLVSRYKDQYKARHDDGVNKAFYG